MPSDSSAPFEEISVETFAQRLQNEQAALQLIDVREPSELELAALDGFENLPLSEFAAWSGTIHSRFESDKETIVMCHHGMRSAQMCYWLAQQGFTNLKNLSGGIDAYSLVVDRSVPRY
ncbi:MAG TPA: rhodanese-like domain-containing protein [Leptolyngbyaceae cyanobacterium]